MSSYAPPDSLACCHGYGVTAGEVEIGHVETPIFAGLAREPEFLLVRTSRAISGTFRVVPAGIVVWIDRDGRRIAITVDVNAVDALPEWLPLGRVAP
jgi:hypothetical protein